MSKLTIRKCSGCGGPLEINTSLCIFCGSENVETSAANDVMFFDIKLISTGPKLINVIKLIREITKLGLKEAKNKTDTLPSYIKKDIKKYEVEELKRDFESLGATIEISKTNSKEITYRSPENKNQEKTNPGCFSLIGIIFSSVLLMCALILIFGLDDIINV